MPCYTPIMGYRGRGVLPSGRRPIVFKVSEGYIDRPVPLPCGKCVGCRLEKSRQWAVRVIHELQTNDGVGHFLTLTYDEDHLPAGETLVKADLQKFFKRLRKNTGEKVRYFACGEYGDERERPHYHACIMGLDLRDLRPWACRKGNPSFRSETIEKSWQLGNSEVGTLTFESAAYVARYTVKGSRRQKSDSVDVETGELFTREPEFAIMSRKPGIGFDWLQRFGAETYRDDSIVIRGQEMKPPRYYDEKWSEIDSESVESVKAERERKRNPANETPARLAAREKVARARLSLRGRRLDLC